MPNMGKQHRYISQSISPNPFQSWVLPLKWDWVSLLRDVPVIQLRGRRRKEVALGDGSLYRVPREQGCDLFSGHRGYSSLAFTSYGVGRILFLTNLSTYIPSKETPLGFKGCSGTIPVA